MGEVTVAFGLAEASDEERDMFEDVLAETGAQRTSTVGPEVFQLDPITAAVVIGGGVVVVRTLASLWERWKGGTLIEVTNDGLKVTRSREVAYGYFVIKGSDGKVEVKAVDEAKDALERMGQGILKLPVDATVATIKAEIEAAAPAAETNVVTEPS